MIWPFFKWSLLPSLVARSVTSVWWRVMVPAEAKRAPYMQEEYRRFFRRVLMMVIATYLLYSLYAAILTTRSTPTFYDVLMLPRDAHVDAIRRQSRNLLKSTHPDKVGPEGHDMFITARIAVDTLTNATKRFAYEKFGPQMIDWKECSTTPDFLLRGAMYAAREYGVALLFMIVLDRLGQTSARFSRFFLLVALMAIEGRIVAGASSLIPGLLPFEQVQLLKELAYTLFSAMSQLVPLFHPEASGEIAASVAALERVANLAAHESAVTLASETVSFGSGTENSLAHMRRQLLSPLQTRFVETRIRNDAEMRAALQTYMQEKQSQIR